MKWGYVIYHFWHRYINYRILYNEKAEKKPQKKPSRTAATLVQATTHGFKLAYHPISTLRH